MEKNIKLSDLSISELVDYEKATKVICSFIENSIKNYDGTIVDNVEEYQRYTKYNQIYIMILKELEKRVNCLTNDGKKD